MRIPGANPLLFFILFIFIVGCGKVADKDAMEIRQVIWWYDEALIRVYHDLDPKPLYGLASEKEIGRIRMVIWKFMGEKSYMESELKSLKFEKIEKKGGNSADVETFEKWRFRHLKEGTKEVVKPWRDEEYRLLYKVVKSEGRWIVESSEFLN